MRIKIFLLTILIKTTHNYDYNSNLIKQLENEIQNNNYYCSYYIYL